MLDKEKKIIWGQYEREFAFYTMPGYRKALEAGILEELGITEADLDGDPKNQEIFLEKLRSWAAGAVFVCKIAPYTRSIAHPARSPKTPLLSPWGRHLFERRFNIVKFVFESRAHHASTRVRWKQIAPEWNRAHPRDILNPIQMKTLYKRAIKEDGIMIQVMVISVPDAFRKMDEHPDWNDGKPHLRTIKTPYFTVTDSTNGGENER
ncbi:MAG: hypothetical protein WC566_05795 [Dehalococcoidia bacterium]